MRPALGILARDPNVREALRANDSEHQRAIRLGKNFRLMAHASTIARTERVLIQTMDPTLKRWETVLGIDKTGNVYVRGALTTGVDFTSDGWTPRKGS